MNSNKATNVLLLLLLAVTIAGKNSGLSKEKSDERTTNNRASLR